jgi:hypothetical protein
MRVEDARKSLCPGDPVIGAQRRRFGVGAPDGAMRRHHESLPLFADAVVTDD